MSAARSSETASAAPKAGSMAQESRRIDLPTGTLQLEVEPGPFALDELVGFAARANAKRGFLFVSKVLGKHWPATPRSMLRLHEVLAAGIPATVPGPVLFIAMAETATGLGHGVFEAFVRQRPEHAALFLHTTRYRVGDGPLIEFEESHSHAPRQFLHLPTDAALLARFHSARTLVLVDDEISTGNTFVNLAQACRALNPGLAHIHLATLTDFAGAALQDALALRFGLPLSRSQALRGQHGFQPAYIAPPTQPAQRFNPQAQHGASPAFGRLGMDHLLALPAEGVRHLCATLSPAAPVLVLGTGEFMHPAFCLARALEDAGFAVQVQSTTRSPILHGGAISHVRAFGDNYAENIANYLYNVPEQAGRQVLICHETPPVAALLDLARSLGARLLHFRAENAFAEIPVC